MRRNMAVNCSETRFQTSWTAVLLPMKVVDICRGRGGWVGGWVGWVGENEAVRMSCWRTWVGGWVND